MAVPRALRSLLGPSVASAAVAVVALASVIVYLLLSKAVQVMSANWSYLQFVQVSLLKSPHAHAFAFGFAPSVGAALTSIAFAASCLIVGVIVARAFQGRPAALPMGWIAGLAAAVVPTLVIATVRWPDGSGSITNGTICVGQLILVVLAWLWSRRYAVAADASTAAPIQRPGDSLSLWLKLGIALTACYAATILVNGLSGVFGYDSFSDHLAVPGRWLVTGRLVHGLPEEMVSYYPGNFELLVRWTLSLGTDRLAFLLSFGSCMAAVWVVFRIALELGQTRAPAIMSALAAASLQVIAYQSIVVYSDSYTALCLLLATWLLIIWVREGTSDNRLTVGIGLALGLALGAKYSAGPPVVVLGFVWLWNVWRACWQRDAARVEHFNWRTFFRASVSLTAGTLPPMAYWYGRNALEQHNPLFPLSVAGLPGLNIGALLANVPGPKNLFEQLAWPWTEVGHIAGYETGLGPVFATIAVVAVCMVPFIARHVPRPQVRLVWVILIGAWLAWTRTGVLVPRYGFFPLLLSFVFVGELWTAYSSRLLGVVFAATVGMTMLSVGHEMLGGAAYNELFFDPLPRVPAAIDQLPPSRILNAAGQPSGYYARGRDMRHLVISPFKGVTPDDVVRLAPDYLLIPQVREPEFVEPLKLTLVGRWEKAGQPPTSLWRVNAQRGDSAR